jgi:diaminohydroxyphosphoribosylaminopyrimidine deaminase/5-amino-6-(5-phosphoribosylamino)uracil reductase
VFTTLDAGPVILMTTAAAARRYPERTQTLQDVGATVIEGDGDLRSDLHALARREISTVLLEGGAVMHAAAWRAGLIDRLHLIIAPRALGDGGVKLFDGIDVPLSDLSPTRVDSLGPDTWLEADVHGHR